MLQKCTTIKRRFLSGMSCLLFSQKSKHYATRVDNLAEPWSAVSDSAEFLAVTAINVSNVPSHPESGQLTG